MEEDHAKRLAALIGGEVTVRESEDHDSEYVVIHHCQDGRALIFSIQHVYEFPNHETLDQTLAIPPDEDYLFPEPFLYTNKIRIE